MSFQSILREAFDAAEIPTWVAWDGVIYALDELLCRDCGVEYGQHPSAPRPLKAKRGQPVRLCDGSVVVVRERPS